MRTLIGAILLSLSSPAVSEVPNVVADIAPVQSLVASVMTGLGAPEVLLPIGASPHDHAFRPSAARALQRADAVFWVGDALTPWLEQPLETLATGLTTALKDLDGVTLHEAGGHDHDHNDGHDHGDGIDPHLWLDPDNAVLWLTHIADSLGRIDPENAALYAKNAASEIERIAALKTRFTQELSGLDPKYIVLHDAFGYFEERFSVEALGAITSTSDSAIKPGPLRDVQEAIVDQSVQCVLTEPGYDPDIVETVFGDGVEVAVIEIDPLGAKHEAGPDLYRNLLSEIAEVMIRCAS